MNKLILDNNTKNIVINEDTNIYFDNNLIESITIMNNVKLIVNIFCDNINHEIKYILGDKSLLIVNKLSINGNDKVEILLNGEGASVEYNYAHINNLDSEYNINVYHNNKMTKSHVVNHGICLNNHKLTFNISGYNKKESSNTLINQDNKIICLNDNYASIKPNLYIDNNEIEASHSAYIGKFNKDIIFYLMSRGLSNKECYQLLIKTFLIGNMNIDYEIKNVFLKAIKNIGE